MTVDSVSAVGNLDTPGLKYNSEQARLHLPMFMVQRGDVITSLNGYRSADQMLTELQKVTTPTGTRPMTLELERLLFDRLEAPPPRTPSLPPRGNGDRGHRSSVSRSSGAGSTSAGHPTHELRRAQSVPNSPCAGPGGSPGEPGGRRSPARPQSVPPRKRRAAAWATEGPSETAFAGTLPTPWGRSLERDWRKTLQGTVPVGKLSSQGWHKAGGRSVLL